MSEPKQSLLIVDDEPSIRMSMSLLLAEIGYSVRSAEDGSSALEAMRRAIPDILLSDLNMPGMSGFELLSVVRQRFPAIHTIAMSGAFCGNEVPSGVAADAFYPKGGSLGALQQTLRTLPAVASLRTHCGGNDLPAKAPVAYTCPVCLRELSRALDTRNADCVYCGNSIQYTTVASSDQVSPQAFHRKAQAANLAQNASSSGN